MKRRSGVQYENASGTGSDMYLEDLRMTSREWHWSGIPLEQDGEVDQSKHGAAQLLESVKDKADPGTKPKVWQQIESDSKLSWQPFAPQGVRNYIYMLRSVLRI